MAVSHFDQSGFKRILEGEPETIDETKARLGAPRKPHHPQRKFREGLILVAGVQCSAIAPAVLRGRLAKPGSSLLVVGQVAQLVRAAVS